MSYKNKDSSLWTSINKVPCTYPWLSDDEHTSVCIIGSGISGALCALRFASCGIDTVLLSPKPIAFGSTSFSDGTIKTDMYEGLLGLSSKLGIPVACRVYERLEQSMDCLENIAIFLGNGCHFTRAKNLVYTKNDDLSYDLHKEYLLRRDNGFDVNVLNNDSTKQDNKLNVELGIVTQNTSAIFDPFIFTHMIVKAAKDYGARVYENSPVEKIITGKKSPSVCTFTNRYVHASKIIVSIDDKENTFLKNVGTFKTKFTLITKPLNNMLLSDDPLTACKWDYPEITFSTTQDKRIIVSGPSSGYINEDKKMSGIIPTSMIKRSKYSRLRKELLSLFSGVKKSDIEFKFCSNYLKTNNGLPKIIQRKRYPDCYFSLCPDENSFIFSEIASDVLLSLYTGKKTDLSEIFL